MEAGAAARLIGITGGGGNLGGEVAQRLRAEGFELDDLDGYCRQPTAAGLQQLPQRLQWVLHFAARTSIAQSFGDPQGFLRENLAATQAALDAAVRGGAAMLYMSSYVYGTPQVNPIDESHPLAELNPYMASKLAGERLAQQVCADHGLPLVILRPFSVYGRKRQPGRLVSDLLDCLREGRPLTIQDPAPARDYLHVRDFCALVLAIVSAQPPRSGVYNVGSGVAHTNLELAETLRALAGEPRPVQVVGVARPNDVPLCVADLRAVQRDYAWQPRLSLREGLADVLAALPLAERRGGDTG